MKCLFLLVVLLPLCYSSNQTLDVTGGIMSRLKELKFLFKTKKVTITSWDNLKVPSTTMLENTSNCTNTFKNGLKHLLNNLTAVEKTQTHLTNLIEEITSNLEELPTSGQEEVERCTMRPLSHGRKEPFTQYIIFLKNFNNLPVLG